jgi:subtilisin family serine protease
MRMKKIAKTTTVVLAFFLLLAHDLPGVPAGAFLDGAFQEGRKIFYDEVNLRFGLHPLKFSLRPENIRMIQNAETEIPFLYENLVNILYLENQPQLEPLLEGEDKASEQQFRSQYLHICREAADCFVESIFQEISGDIGRGSWGIPAKTRLEIILDSISQNGTGDSILTNESLGSLSSLSMGDLWSFGISGFKEANKTTKGENVRVAVIDSGFGRKGISFRGVKINRDLCYCLTGRTKAPWSDEQLPLFDETGHGTLAVLTASAGAPEAEFIIYKMAFSSHPVVPYWRARQVAAGIHKAVSDQADVILVTSVFDRDFAFLKQACQFAYENNTVIVCPNGQSSPKMAEKPYAFPAHYNSTVAVGGVIPDKNKRPVLWKNTGSSHYTSVSAPAEGMAAFIKRDNAWAASMTAGLVALLASRIPKSDKELCGQYFQRVYEVLIRSSQPEKLGFRTFDPRMGYGLIDAGLGVTRGVADYLVRMQKIEENFQKRMKERQKQEEEKKKQN